MKKGQLSVEAMLAVSMVVVYVALLFNMGRWMEDEAAGRNSRLSSEMECRELARVIGSVQASGEGTVVEFDVRGNMSVYPGFVKSQEDDFYIGIDRAAVRGVTILSSRAYRVANRRGYVEFT